MRLAEILFGRQALPRRLFSGKHRLPRRVFIHDSKKVLINLAREEENLFYLRQPYLTKEQEDRYIENVELPREKAMGIISHKKVRPHATIKDRLEHMKVTANWE